MNYQPIELLSPAGNSECIQAAIENGADAVYFGIDDGFNARARASNLSLDTLSDTMRMMHQRGVKGYVTLNTLVFSDELAQFERIIREVARADVDAVLLQDLGAVRLVRSICPDLPIHASTQMTMTSAENIAEIETWGIDRVVLARELSIDEIRKIAETTTMPLEVFAHGALCVAYSGQCLTSESLGGRSANRGQCAQACRLPYDLICDGVDRDLGDQRYLLSPQDLAAYELIPDLISAGVCCLKIEGRLKTPEYVANITRHYRTAIDQAVAGRSPYFEPTIRDEMELSFSRGFSPGWLNGCDHKMLVPAISSAKRGIRLGTVVKFNESGIDIELEKEVQPGDGVVFESPHDRSLEQGGRVYHVDQKISHDGTKVARLEFAHGAIDTSRLYRGQAVWKTDDPKLTKRLRQSFQTKYPHRKLTVDFQVNAIVGRPLEVCVEIPSCDLSLAVSSEDELATARKHPASNELLREQFSRLGNTQFQLGDLRATIEGQPMIPLSVLGKLRKTIVDRLEVELGRASNRMVSSESVLAAIRPTAEPSSAGSASLTVLCRTINQLEVVLKHGIREVMVDFQDIREYRQAVALGSEHDANVYLATPRIQKPGEMGIFQSMAKHQPKGVLVRNLSGIRFFVDREIPIVADASLNVANEITASMLHELNVKRMTVSYDLNRDQVEHLVQSAPAEWFEVVVHQHMPMFHMEHCVFCSVLSPGTDKTNCGRPCDFHSVKLRDRVGMEHTLTADVGCRNTLFNAKAQSAAEIVHRLRDKGVRFFRVELLDHTEPTEIIQTIDAYTQLLRGEITGRQVWTRLQASNRVGVTRGTLEEKRDPLAIL